MMRNTLAAAILLTASLSSQVLRLPAGCSLPLPFDVTPAHIGQTFRATIDGGDVPRTGDTYLIRIGLTDGFGRVNGCRVRVLPSWEVALTGRTVFYADVPNNPALVGTRFFLQACGQSRLSDGFRVTVEK